MVELDRELVAASRALVERLRAFIAEAATVGEFLPSNTSRILNTVAKLTDAFGDATDRPAGAPIDAIDDVLAVAVGVRRDVERVDRPRSGVAAR